MLSLVQSIQIKQILTQQIQHPSHGIDGFQAPNNQWYLKLSLLLSGLPVFIEFIIVLYLNNQKIKSKIKQDRQMQYQPIYGGSCGYRSDSTIDRKHFTGIESVAHLRIPQGTLATSNFYTG